MSAAAVSTGSAAIPQAESTIPPTSQADMDEALKTLAANKEAWVRTGIPERIRLLDQLRESTMKEAHRWIQAAVRAKGITPGTPAVGEEWIGGPVLVIRNLRLLAKTLEDIQKYGRPLLPGPVTTREDGQVVAQVFPTDTYDKLLFGGFTGEVWMDPEVTLESLHDTMADIYRNKREGNPPEPKVALVLGAGNVSSIGPMDAIYKFFVEDQVVVLKMNPVNEYLGPIIQDAFKPLVERGMLRIVYGGAKEGDYLCQHETVDEIHITGSDKTHDAIVYGVGKKGAEAKKKDKRRLDKRVTSELGNVSPVIVVPGPWSAGDLEFQGANIASMLTNNAGFNCNATRVIVTHKGWGSRHGLLDQVRKVLQQAPTRKAYYPGAEDRHKSFLDAHSNAEEYGAAGSGHLPWTFIPNVDPGEPNDICFTTEAFCGVFCETALDAADPVEFLEQAVDFANDEVWGTLNCTLIVHPKSLEDPRMAKAVDKAVADLRFGSVAVNHWAALAYGFVSTTWGAFPGHTYQDIRSGIGVVHNTYLFDKPQKTVIRGPFKVRPKPPWFVTHKTVHELGEKLAAFEADPSPWKIPGLLWAALRG